MTIYTTQSNPPYDRFQQPEHTSVGRSHYNRAQSRSKNVSHPLTSYHRLFLRGELYCRLHHTIELSSTSVVAYEKKVHLWMRKIFANKDIPEHGNTYASQSTSKPQKKQSRHYNYLSQN